MKNRMGTAFIAWAVLLFVACGSMRTTVRYDENANFMNYRTFALVSPREGRRPLFNRNVLDEIKSVLAQKGLAEADRGSADLLVHFYAMVKNRRDFVPPAYRVGRWGRVWAVRPGHVVNYKEGTLVIDMVDRARSELVWEGEGKDILDRTDPSRNLVEAVGKVLESFPPGK